MDFKKVNWELVREFLLEQYPSIEEYILSWNEKNPEWKIEFFKPPSVRMKGGMAIAITFAIKPEFRKKRSIALGYILVNEEELRTLGDLIVRMMAQSVNLKARRIDLYLDHRGLALVGLPNGRIVYQVVVQDYSSFQTKANR